MRNASRQMLSGRALSMSNPGGNELGWTPKTRLGIAANRRSRRQCKVTLVFDRSMPMRRRRSLRSPCARLREPFWLRKVRIGRDARRITAPCPGSVPSKPAHNGSRYLAAAIASLRIGNISPHVILHMSESMNGGYRRCGLWYHVRASLSLPTGVIGLAGQGHILRVSRPFLIA